MQKPHCSPWQSANACCSGCSSPLSAAVPPGELGEAPPAQGRELHRLDELVVLQAGLQRAGEQAAAVRAGLGTAPAGQPQAADDFGGRIGVRQAAAERAAGADGGVAHPAGGLGEQRMLALGGERAVPGQGADPQAAAGPRADRVQAGDAVDVDKDAGLGQPQRQQGHQALAARDDLALAVLVGRRQRRDGVLDAAGPDVVEGCWLHRYRPRNLGERLSVRARRPSAASSLAQQASKSLASPALSGSLRAFLA